MPLRSLPNSRSLRQPPYLPTAKSSPSCLLLIDVAEVRPQPLGQTDPTEESDCRVRSCARRKHRPTWLCPWPYSESEGAAKRAHRVGVRAIWSPGEHGAAPDRKAPVKQVRHVN